MSILDVFLEVAVASAILKTTKKLSEDKHSEDDNKYKALGVKD